MQVGLMVDSTEMKNQNQFTPKAFVIRYWDRVIKNNLPKPSFILSKTSPLSAADAYSFAKYAGANTLSTKLPEFCSAAKLLCFLDISPQSYRKEIDLDKKLSFTSYGVTNPFIDYAKKGILFGIYTKSSPTNFNTRLVKNWVQSGKFFREKMLKEGVVMHMPDIRDKLPKRSFLPRSILTKLPFASSKLDEMKQVFKVSKNSSMEKMIVNSLSECEKVPSKGEVKRCVGSLEDMIDFVTSILSRNVTVRSTKNVNGSNKNIMLSQVRGIKNGKVIELYLVTKPYFLTCYTTATRFPRFEFMKRIFWTLNLRSRLIVVLQSATWTQQLGVPPMMHLCHLDLVRVRLKCVIESLRMI
jgi:hypothetical protein